MSADLTYHRHLIDVAMADIDYVLKKDTQYAASWKQRGGVGAFFTIVRPWDRFVNMLDPSKVPGDAREAPISARAKRPVPAFDLFEAIRADGLVGEDGTVIACVRDLRRYLLLVEAHMVEEMVGDGPRTPLTRMDFANIEARAMAHASESGDLAALVRHGAVPRTPEEKARQFSAMYGSGTPEDGGHHERANVLIQSSAAAVAPWIVERGQSVMPACYDMRAKDVWLLAQMVEDENAIPVHLRCYYWTIHFDELDGSRRTAHLLRADMMPDDIFNSYFLPLPTEVNDFELRECKPRWHSALYAEASNGTKLVMRDLYKSWTVEGR